LGTGTYDFFLFLNGSAGILLIGTAVGTFFTGANFRLNDYNLVTWQHPLRGLEAAFNPFNLSLGIFLAFVARLLGALYLLNNIDFSNSLMVDLGKRLRNATFNNLLICLPFLCFVLFRLVMMDGFAINPITGSVVMESGKYLHNLLAMPIVLFMLIAGLVFVVLGVVVTRFMASLRGIWLSGPGTVLVGLAVFFIAGFHNTPFYPSNFAPDNSLSIYNASSSRYTLAVMSYVALAVPFVLAYIAYFWHLMDKKKLTFAEVNDSAATDLY
jgi:cytochrome d ubiquinol oxidase subunit II